jgi:hypothetical protein
VDEGSREALAEELTLSRAKRKNITKGDTEIEADLVVLDSTNRHKF